MTRPATETDNLHRAEVDKFSDLAERWWEPDGPLKTLHVVNPARSAYIAARVKLEDRNLLDAGCGGGILAESLARRGAHVTGIDASEEAIRIARRHAAQQQLAIDYSAQTAEQLRRGGDKKFDIITCMELLEHVPTPPALIQTLAQLLNHNGHLILSTINRNLRAYLGAIVAAEYLLRLLPKGTHDYAKFIRPSELCAWLRNAGFSIEHIAGLHYLPGIDYCAIGDSPSVNYLIHARLGGA